MPSLQVTCHGRGPLVGGCVVPGPGEAPKLSSNHGPRHSASRAVRHSLDGQGKPSPARQVAIVRGRARLPARLPVRHGSLLRSYGGRL